MHQKGRRSIGEVASRFDGLISMTSQPPSETPCQCEAAASTGVFMAGCLVLHIISASGERKTSEATTTFWTAGMVCSQ